MYAIVFRSARLVVSLASASAFDAAKAALLPFEDESAHTAEEYAEVAQAIRGQEMSIEAAKEAGILDEDAFPVPGATVYVAA